MKLLIFGASGGTGQQLVAQALEQGHTVSAFVRRPEAMTEQSPNLSLVQGDILDQESVRRAVKGQEVVLSALGTRSSQAASALADGTRHILEAMDEHGVRRSIWVTSFGVGESLAQMGWVARNVFVPMFLKRALDEKEVQERIIRRSLGDWIIARPGGLTDGPCTGVYRIITDSNTTVGRPSIARADVADFMLKNLTGNAYLRQAVGLTY